MRTKNYYIPEVKRILIDGIGMDQTIFIYDRYSGLRKRNVNNHVEFDDYFATLATILNCIKDSYEQMGKNEAKKIVSANKENLKRLDNLKNDLLYLQENFTIVKKNNSSINTLR